MMFRYSRLIARSFHEKVQLSRPTWWPTTWAHR